MADRVQAMVDDSEARDHLYQVAGDIIQGFPERLSAAERALDRTSYAMTVMGEDFLRGRISLDDRSLVDESLKAAPFSGSRDKESAPERVAHRYLSAGPERIVERLVEAAEDAPEGAAPSAEHYFFGNPEKREVMEFVESEAISNKPGVATKSVKESDSPDRTVSEAKTEAKDAPLDPTEIRSLPGGKQFSTLNRFLIETEQPGVKNVPEGREDLPRQQKIVASKEPVERFLDEESGTESRVFDLGSKGFSVSLVDLDSGNTFPVHRFFASLDLAIQFAKKIANVK